MPQSLNKKRLASIEVKLTPKEWAIRLLDEMRQYPCDEDFNRAMAKGEYQDSPYIKPFLALAQQAKERYPRSTPQAIMQQDQLNRRLRLEFHALKTLVNNVNEEVKIKTGMIRLQVRALAFQLSALIHQDAFARTAERVSPFVEQYKTTDPAEEEERRLTIEELSTLVLTVGSRTHFSSLTSWADDSAMVLMELLAWKAAVQAIQKTYFNGHPILMRDVEGALETAIQTIRDAGSKFNDYLKMRSDSFGRGLEKEDLSEDKVLTGWQCIAVDVEAIGQRANEMRLVDGIVSNWVTAAKDKGTADILQETGEQQNFLWERFRQKRG